MVWRRVAIPFDLSFHDLHLIIQAAMGWEHQHLYAFSEHLESRYFTVVSPYAEEFGANARMVPADNILWQYLNQFHIEEDEERDKMYYQYDYGDDWMHEIDVEGYEDSNSPFPELLNAEGACPPENCGGPPGFQMFKDYIRSDMSKEEYFNLIIAVNPEGYDAHHVDMADLKRRVKNWRSLDH